MPASPETAPSNPRDRIVDAVDVESFVLCESEQEARQIIAQLMSSMGLHRHLIVSLDFNGPGAHFRARGYVNRPGEAYTWLRA